WRQFPYIITAVIGAYRFHPFGMVVGEVFIRQKAAVLFHKGIDGGGYITFIKSIAAAFCNFFQGIGKVGISADISPARYFTAGIIKFNNIWILPIKRLY